MVACRTGIVDRTRRVHVNRCPNGILVSEPVLGINALPIQIDGKVVVEKRRGKVE